MPEIGEFAVRGSPLICPECHGRSFTKRLALPAPDAGLSHDAENYECDACGYVFWFLNR